MQSTQFGERRHIGIRKKQCSGTLAAAAALLCEIYYPAVNQAFVEAGKAFLFIPKRVSFLFSC
jgi:hypothetical protein